MNGLTQNEIEKAQDYINEIAPKFASEVQPLFVQNNWTWAFGLYDSFVPTVQDIESTVKRLAEYLSGGLGKMHASCSTGRIEIIVIKWDDSFKVSVNLTPIWQDQYFSL